MPTDWNGRFLFEGGGNLDGVDWPAYGSLFRTTVPAGTLRAGSRVHPDNSVGQMSPTGSSTDATFALWISRRGSTTASTPSTGSHWQRRRSSASTMGAPGPFLFRGAARTAATGDGGGGALPALFRRRRRRRPICLHRARGSMDGVEHQSIEPDRAQGRSRPADPSKAFSDADLGLVTRPY